MRFSYKSYAKINLFLNIIDFKQPYHMLQSVFALINIYDIVCIHTNSTEGINYYGKFAYAVPHNNNNILNKTVNYFKQHYNINNLQINVLKNIPVGSGLGGASSNCATVILAINKIFNLQLSHITLLDIAKQLGADVPFFLFNELSFVQGFGEQITPLNFNLNNINALIVFPNFNISTKEVFNNYKILNKHYNSIDTQNINNNNIFTLSKNIGNKLQPIAATMYPAINNILSCFDNSNCLLYGLSGSGSACFGLYNHNINEYYNIFKQKFANYTIYRTKLITPAKIF